MLNDIIKAGLDDLVEALPSQIFTREDYEQYRYEGVLDEDMPSIGQVIGQRIWFDREYKKILEQKSTEKKKENPLHDSSLAETESNQAEAA